MSTRYGGHSNRHTVSFDNEDDKYTKLGYRWWARLIRIACYIIIACTALLAMLFLATAILNPDGGGAAGAANALRLRFLGKHSDGLPAPLPASLPAQPEEWDEGVADSVKQLRQMYSAGMSQLLPPEGSSVPQAAVLHCMHTTMLFFLSTHTPHPHPTTYMYHPVCWSAAVTSCSPRPAAACFLGHE